MAMLLLLQVTMSNDECPLAVSPVIADESSTDVAAAAIDAEDLDLVVFLLFVLPEASDAPSENLHRHDRVLGSEVRCLPIDRPDETEIEPPVLLHHVTRVQVLKRVKRRVDEGEAGV